MASPSSSWVSVPWLREALIQLGLAHYHQARGPRGLVKSAFPSFKQRTKKFFQDDGQPKA